MDITMCEGKDCDLAKTCLRHVANQTNIVKRILQTAPIKVAPNAITT
jgi:hypothetical protein